ncbi:hypothetical protein KFJ24_07875 [Marinobacter sediminum]|uniref:hypothetical protein n=1 Tax=Marinobacter sediminum TaxID=256323 RepID=UPI00202E25C9|nr:hypothetical protein [Marinobacter sediminum]MCM0612391.1 hypothetical protein [Marinobacter sediminum]
MNILARHLIQTPFMRRKRATLTVEMSARPKNAVLAPLHYNDRWLRPAVELVSIMLEQKKGLANALSRKESKDDR